MKKWRHFSKCICFEADAGLSLQHGKSQILDELCKNPNARFSVSGSGTPHV